MPKITYIEGNGTQCTVEVPVGWTVMEGAVKNRVPGIDADCGGAREEMEESMLDFALDVRPESRLSCQLNVTDAFDGLVVRTPKSQH